MLRLDEKIHNSYKKKRVTTLFMMTRRGKVVSGNENELVWKKYHFTKSSWPLRYLSSLYP